MGVADDEGVIGEARVDMRVAHDETAGRLVDHVGAERLLAPGLTPVQADPRLEPLAALVDEAHDRDRRAQRDRGEAHEAVEPLLGAGVQQTRPDERQEARRFVVVEHGCEHGGDRPPGAPGCTDAVRTFHDYPLFGGMIDPRCRANRLLTARTVPAPRGKAWNIGENLSGS